MLGLSPIGMGRSWAYSSAYVYGRSGAAGTEPVGQVNPVQTTPVPPVEAPAPVQRGTAQPAAQGEGPLSFPPPESDPVEMAVRGRIQYVDPDELLAAQEGQETKSPQEVMEEGQCQTCKERKYQDRSDDPGVSFQTPTNIAPEQAAAAVRGHEQEHVVREQSKALREDREVVNQSVTLHTDICPECGRVYISGGTTRTTTRAREAAEPTQQEGAQSGSFQAVA